MNVEGKVVLVTGAAGGLGAILCQTFCEAGAQVVATDLAWPIDEERHAATLVLDVRSEPGWSDTVQEIMRRFQRLDVLVNNAGVAPPSDSPPLAGEPWETVLGVNATGTFLGLRHAIPAMSRGGGGSIVNIASIAAHAGMDFVHMAYGASKAAVVSMTRTAAVQFAHQGIRVNAVLPGLMERMASARQGAPSHRQTFLPKIPMRRAGAHQEVAAAVRFLASDASSYVTGTELVVDGGYLAQ